MLVPLLHPLGCRCVPEHAATAPSICRDLEPPDQALRGAGGHTSPLGARRWLLVGQREQDRSCCCFLRGCSPSPLPAIRTQGCGEGCSWALQAAGQQGAEQLGS